MTCWLYEACAELIPHDNAQGAEPYLGDFSRNMFHAGLCLTVYKSVAVKLDK